MVFQERRVNTKDAVVHKVSHEDLNGLVLLFLLVVGYAEFPHLVEPCHDHVIDWLVDSSYFGLVNFELNHGWGHSRLIEVLREEWIGVRARDLYDGLLSGVVLHVNVLLASPEDQIIEHDQLRDGSFSRSFTVHATLVKACCAVVQEYFTALGTYRNVQILWHIFVVNDCAVKWLLVWIAQIYVLAFEFSV